MKTKNFILLLAVGSLFFVLADAVTRLKHVRYDEEIIKYIESNKVAVENIRHEIHEHYRFAGFDAIVIASQGVIIFLTFKLKGAHVA